MRGDIVDGVDGEVEVGDWGDVDWGLVVEGDGDGGDEEDVDGGSEGGV